MTDQDPTVATGEDAVTIEGTVRGFYGSDECGCCDGPHRFSTGVVVDPEVVDASLRRDKDGIEVTRLDTSLWLHRALRAMPEGATVRLTIERLAPFCPSCGRRLVDATGDWQCHSCQRLWPRDYFDIEALSELGR